MKKSLLRPKHTTCDIILDESKYYFSGDLVRGQLVIQPTKPTQLTGIRLEFYGHIKTFINIRKQDGHYFFKQLVRLNVQPGTLKTGNTYTWPFEFILPMDNPLPSCTECNTTMGGGIDYVIKAIADRPSSRDAITTTFHLPVLEKLDIRGMAASIWDIVTWQSQYPENIIDQDEYHGVDQVDLTASLPHKGYTRDQQIPVTVVIQHFQPYQRTKGLDISLIRNTRIVCKEKAYHLPPSVITSVKLDINIPPTTTSQTITTSLVIPQHISPTITSNARLMQVDYSIDIKADLDSTDYPFMDKRQGHLTSMRLQLPVIIGTFPLTSTPPPIVPPTFAKQQQRSSLFAGFDLSSIPATLLDISSVNLRGDSYSSMKRHINNNTNNELTATKQVWSPPGSIHDTNPLSPALSSVSSTSSKRTTVRSSSLFAPTIIQDKPCYLPLSLGEPFDLLQTSFIDTNNKIFTSEQPLFTLPEHGNQAVDPPPHHNTIQSMDPPPHRNTILPVDPPPHHNTIQPMDSPPHHNTIQPIDPSPPHHPSVSQYDKPHEFDTDDSDGSDDLISILAKREKQHTLQGDYWQ